MARRVAEFEVLARGRCRPADGSGRASPPAALPGEPARPELRTVFYADGDWHRAAAEVTKAEGIPCAWCWPATVILTRPPDTCAGSGPDVDGRGWPQAGRRDPVIAAAQARLPGLRPYGFHSAYEAAARSVLAQRLRIVQARLRAELIARHGEHSAFPAPSTLRALREQGTGEIAGRSVARVRPGPLSDHALNH